MKIINTMLFFFLLSCTGNSQDMREVGSFDGIDVSGGINITLIEGKEGKIEVEVSNAKLEDLITEVNNGTLDIEFKNKNFNMSNRKANVTVYYESLNEIEASAGSKVYGDQMINVENFEIDASSGASVKIQLGSSDLDVDISSGASVYLKGTSNNLVVDVSSGASFKGTDFKTQSANASASSGGSAKVWVEGSLNADASSGGSVKYKGEPQKTNFDVGKYSGGQVKKM